jgi:K+-transporting ATPase A subunit
MFNLLKSNASFKKLQEAMKVNSGIQRMITVAMSLLFMVHMMACMWYLIASFEEFDYTSWVFAINLQDKENSYQYLVSVYWAIQTITTVGYGDVTPISLSEKVAALLWMIIGVGFYSFTIGNLSSIISNIDVKAAHLQQKLNILSEFSKRTKLPEDV